VARRRRACRRPARARLVSSWRRSSLSRCNSSDDLVAMSRTHVTAAHALAAAMRASGGAWSSSSGTSGGSLAERPGVTSRPARWRQGHATLERWPLRVSKGDRMSTTSRASGPPKRVICTARMTVGLGPGPAGMGVGPRGRSLTGRESMADRLRAPPPRTHQSTSPSHAWPQAAAQPHLDGDVELLRSLPAGCRTALAGTAAGREHVRFGPPHGRMSTFSASRAAIAR
jgi:hypothetical protein